MKPSLLFLYSSFVIVLALAGMQSACSDPTTIGADLLEEDRLGLDYVDTITINASVQPNSPVLVYDGANFANQLLSHPFGIYTDPVFGKVEASLYVQPTLRLTRAGTAGFLTKPNFKDVTLDSVVLVLTLDSTNFFGRPTQTFGLEVYRVTQEIDAVAGKYYSDVTFATQPTPIGSIQFLPRLDTLSVLDYSGIDTLRLSFPHLRITLDPAIGQELISLDTTVYDHDTTFIRVFRGLYLKPTNVTDGLAAFSFNFTTLRAGMYVYYTNDQGRPRQYQFDINELGARVSSFRHEPAGFPVEALLGNAAPPGGVLLAQGMAGPHIRLELPHIRRLQGAIVNYAELEVPLGFFPDDDTLKYRPGADLTLRVADFNGNLDPIADVRFAGAQRTRIFGGVLIRGGTARPDVYRMNVSAQLADMISGRAPNVLYLQLYQKGQRSSRVTLNGPNHPTQKMRLKVAFTKS